MKVEIDAEGRRVALECGETGTSIRELGQQAMTLWRQTDNPHTIPAGFQLDGRRPAEVTNGHRDDGPAGS